MPISKQVLIYSASVCLLAFGASAIYTFFVTVPAAQQDLRAVGDRVVDTVGSGVRILEDTRSDLAVTQSALVIEVHRIQEAAVATTRQANETLKAIAEVSRNTAPVLEKAELVLVESQKTVAAARGPIESTDRFLKDIRPQALGLVAGWKIVGGETATTMRDWRRATPALINGVDQIVKNSDRTTEASARAAQSTAEVMSNFAKATKPLPTWLRIGLGVAPPLAQGAAGAATVYSLTGR